MMQDDPIMLTAVLAIAGAWGGLLAHYGRAIVQHLRDRSSADTNGGTPRRTVAPERIAIRTDAPQKKRDRR